MEDRALKIVEPSTTTVAEKLIPGRGVCLESLFRDHYEDVFLAAYRVCGNVEDAEDVLQSVFLRLLKRTKGDRVEGINTDVESLGLGDKPASYICRAAINASLDVLRAKRRKPTAALDDENIEMGSKLASADSEINRREQRRHLREALLEVNARAAEMFVLRYFEEYSNNEIADIFDTTASTVAVTLHRTRDRLQELLREFGGQTS